MPMPMPTRRRAAIPAAARLDAAQTGGDAGTFSLSLSVSSLCLFSLSLFPSPSPTPRSLISLLMSATACLPEQDRLLRVGQPAQDPVRR